MNKTYLWMLPAAAATALAGCGDDNTNTKTDAEFRSEVVSSMQASISVDLGNLVDAAKALQAAAPDHAWDPIADAAAITAMKAAWKTTRIAYEHVEGATAPVFSDLDFSMDARWDDFMTALEATGGDQDLFDDQGVTGMHAIERILYSDQIRAIVITNEMTRSPNYVEATFPSTDDDAAAFKNLLVQKLVTDSQSLKDQWTPAQIDLDFAFDGLVGLMNEQGEKVNLAATGEEESRYSDLTLFDLRNNLDGTTKIYKLFSPWIVSKTGGDDADATVEARLTALGAVYAATPGDAIPDVPDDWSSDATTAANFATPFGVLWKAVRDNVDPAVQTSVVFEMNLISTDVLKLKQLPPE